jgi:serine/threonine protein kinase
MASRNSTSSVKEMRIIQAIQKLAHRNLLLINQVWSIPDYIVVAMELAEGSLLDLLEGYQSEYSSPLPPSMAVGYLQQAASALDFLNARRHVLDGRLVGFQHCDIKPSNLLLIGEIVKLADFGLCTPTVALQSTYSRAGTIDFAAPEVHRGHLADTSDQYSLAITYHYLRTGAFPFTTPSGVFRPNSMYRRPAPDLSRVQRGERMVLEQALDLEPTNRFPSCSGMVAALHNALVSTQLAMDPSSAEMRALDPRVASTH